MHVFIAFYYLMMAGSFYIAEAFPISNFAPFFWSLYMASYFIRTIHTNIIFISKAWVPCFRALPPFVHSQLTILTALDSICLYIVKSEPWAYVSVVLTSKMCMSKVMFYNPCSCDHLMRVSWVLIGWILSVGVAR